MATYTITTDQKYSDAPYIAGDIFNITNQATFTIDSNTQDIATLQVLSTNKGGRILFKNTSTTTPIFIKINNQILAQTISDAIIESQGALIQIGTGNGSTTTFTLPQNSLGENYSNLGCVWVDHGDQFRNGESYFRSYGQVTNLSLINSLERISDVFVQNTTSNTITFKNPPPVGAAIYVPNIQIKLGSTPVATPQFRALTTAICRLNYISISNGFSIGFAGCSEVNWNYCGIAEDVGSSDFTNNSGILYIKNSSVRFAIFNFSSSPQDFIFKNFFFVGRTTTLNKITASNCAGGLIEASVAIIDSSAASGGNNSLLNISDTNNISLYDSYFAGQTQYTVNLTSSDSVIDNVKYSTHAYNSITPSASANHVIGFLCKGTNLLFTNIEQIGTVNTYSNYNFQFSAGSRNITLDTCIVYVNNNTDNIIYQFGKNVRINNLIIKSTDGTIPSSRLVRSDNSSDRLILTNWKLDPSVTGRYTTTDYAFAYKSNATIDRVPLLHDRPIASNAGLPFSIGGENTTSAHYIEGLNVSPSSGVLVINFTNQYPNKPYYLTADVSGKYLIDSLGRLYMDNIGDKIIIQSDTHNGITGVNSIGLTGPSARNTNDFMKLYYDGFHDGVNTLYANETTNRITLYDNIEPYYFNTSVSVRRPNGEWSNEIRTLGQAIKGNFTPTGFYRTGDVITQTLNNGTSISGVVWDMVRRDSNTTHAVLIKNITTNNGTLSGFSITETGISGLSSIVNTRNNYRPTIANIQSSLAQFPDPDAVISLNNTIKNLPHISGNPLEFKFKVQRFQGAASEETGVASFDQYLTSVYLDTRVENYTIPFNVQEISISGPHIADGSRIQLFNISKNVEIANFILNPENPAGIVTTGFSENFDLMSNTINDGDEIRLRVSYQSGVNAFIPLEELGVVTSAGLTFPQFQEVDSVYNQNNIDGSSISGISITPDYTNIQIDLTDNTPPYEITVQEIYNFYIYILTTENGIRNFYDGISPIDVMNYRINTAKVALKIQNTGTTDVIINGGRIFRDDNVSVIDTGAGSGSGSLVHDTGFLIQFIRPQVEASLASYDTAKESSVQNVKKKTNLIPGLF